MPRQNCTGRKGKRARAASNVLAFPARRRAPKNVPTARAGFRPEPTTEGRIDLNKHLIRNFAATYFVRVSGDSMTGAGIHSGDLLMVDRSIEAADGLIVIALVGGELLVKRLALRGGKTFLVPENPNYEELEITAAHELELWGVVTAAVHELLGGGR
jgi:DNA polymerase V